MDEAMNPEEPRKRKSATQRVSQKTLTDTVVGISMAKSSILGFQREVAGNPNAYLTLSSGSNLRAKGTPSLEVPSINPMRRAAQETILENIYQRVEDKTQGTITREEIEKAIETRCITQTLSILYAATYQCRDQNKKVEILENAGEEFTKDDQSIGVRGGGICFSFLRQNGLAKQIGHQEMAVELKFAFEATFQEVKTNLEREGFTVDPQQLKKILASELFRRTGGRNKEGYKIKSGKEAAEALCERIKPQRGEYQSLQVNAQLQAATAEFVEHQIPNELRNHLLENPLMPVYEKNPAGGTLTHPDTGKPILNQALPEKWRKEEIPTTVELAFRDLPEGDTKREVGMLLDTLRLPRKINIPLNVALEGISETLTKLPEVMQKAKEAEKSRMTYEIAKGAHSFAYRLGITTAAAGENLLTQEETQKLEAIQKLVENFPETTSEEAILVENFKLPNEEGISVFYQLEELWRKSKIALETEMEKTPEPSNPPAQPQVTLDPEKPKLHEPVFQTIT